MDQILRLNEFFVEGKDRQKSHVLLHITEPSTPEEKAKGYFFAVCEINNTNTNTIVKLQEIIDEIENNYYNIAETDGQNALEPVLQKINQSGFALTTPDTQISCAVGVIRQNDIVFSVCGNPLMILFYKNKNGAYQKMDLVEQNQPEPTAENQLQLFPQIIQGHIGANDFFFVGSTHVVNYFNLDRLEKIITTRPARQSVEHIERVLSELKNGWSFGGLIINTQPALERTHGEHRQSPSIKGGSTKSLHTFFDTEKNTANILSPSILPRLNDKARTPSPGQPANQETIEETNTRYPQAVINSTHVHQHKNGTRHKQSLTDYKTLSISVFNTLRWSLTKFGRFLLWLVTVIGTILVAIAHALGVLFFLITNYQNRRALIFDNLRRQWTAYQLHIKRLPLITKILLILSILVVVAFVVSVSYINYHRSREIATLLFRDNLTIIKNKKDAAESALIYNNEAGAIVELQGAQTVYGEICVNDTNEHPECDTVKTQLDALAVRLRKEVVMPSKILLDIEALDANQHGGQITKVGNKIIIFSSSSSALVIYDTVSKENKIIPTSIGATGFSSAAAPKENDYGLLLYNKDKLAKFDPKDNSVSAIDMSQINADVNIAAMLIYNRRLYTLDPGHNQIYKYDAIKTGFGRGNEWVKTSEMDLSGAISMTIDGDVFVLKQTGEILKFNAGNVQPFTAQGVEPPLVSADRIWTYTDLQYLYVLDGANKRLVILFKDGRVKQQITAKEWVRPTSMIVDEPNNTAYIFDNNKLYQAALK